MRLDSDLIKCLKTSLGLDFHKWRLDLDLINRLNTWQGPDLMTSGPTWTSFHELCLDFDLLQGLNTWCGLDLDLIWRLRTWLWRDQMSHESTWTWIFVFVSFQMCWAVTTGPSSPTDRRPLGRHTPWRWAYLRLCTVTVVYQSINPGVKAIV